MFPSEIVLELFAYLDPFTLASIAMVCHDWRAISETPLLWRPLYYNRWKHTRAEYRPTDSAEGRFVGDSNWKCLYAERYRLDRQILRSLREIVHESRGRFKKMEHLADVNGPNALDVLWQIMDAPVEQYNLTERYYANRLINRICKRVVLSFWRDQRHARIPQLPIWKGAALLTKWLNPRVELDDIDAQLSSFSSEFLATLSTSPEDDSAPPMTMVQKCRSLVRYFVNHLQFLGNVENYYDIKNSLIDQVISRRLGIPISLGIVFQSIAERAGIETVELIGPPGHVMLRFRDTANLSPPPLPTANITDDDGYLYIDIFNPTTHFFTKSGAVAHLHARFEAQQFEGVILEPAHFAAMRPTEIYLRSLRNIFMTLERSSGQFLRPSPTSEAQNNAILYAITSQMLAIDPAGQSWTIRRRCLYLLQRYWPEDVAFAEEWREDAPGIDWGHVDAIDIDTKLKEERREDERGVVTEIKRRKLLSEGEGGVALNDKLGGDEEMKREEGELEVGVKEGRVEQLPAWKVGTVFKHKIQGYIAVVYGWDLECKENKEWIFRMRVDSLPRGRSQPFFNALVSDGSYRYVAEENMEPLGRPYDLAKVEPSLPVVAELEEEEEDSYEEPFASEEFGKYFEKWDDKAGRYLPNADLRAMYPDD